MTKGSKKLTPFETKQKICSDYNNGVFIEDLKSKYHFSYEKIEEILKEGGVKKRIIGENRRKFPLNKTFFDEIDTQEKAYFLGFLFADGCNMTNHGHIRIGLNPKDREILEKFSLLIYGNINVKEYKNKAHFIKNKWCPETKNVNLSITSKYMSESLSKLGMSNKKSLNVIFPKIPENLINHFVRGYFDGDGCLTFSTNKNVRAYIVKIACSEIFCNKLLQITNKNFPNINCTKSKEGKISLFLVSGPNQCKPFTDWLYKDSQIHLTRKYNKYQELLKYCQEKTDKKYSKYKYISFAKNATTINKWKATWYINGKMENFGGFKTEEEAYLFQQKRLKELLIEADKPTPIHM